MLFLFVINVHGALQSNNMLISPSPEELTFQHRVGKKEKKE